MKRFLGIVIVIALAVITSSAINCNNDKCRESGTQHTMCKYPSSKPASACGVVISVGFTDKERRQILHAHNMHRSFIAQGIERRGYPGPQPPASNMETMVWDNELEEIAQRWAIQCENGISGCAHVDRFLVGQNSARKETTGNVTATPSDMVDIWYKQVGNMDRNKVSGLTSTSGVSAYTQLVWAKTKFIGCGKIAYNVSSHEYYSVVCNYGPSGNFMPEPVYEIELQRK
ncbi:venom allergen 3-like isoform X2 [Osmia bicornis bicornis]|uniref:venom allergen 3-like isoform X2 n=1 Tax=Osmia bicornis bicornis TaxID=1437191 RepID=UPI001EAF2FE9|nr:venom allergen 3-like isoform X2 [Osmia bicornis bicornis]